MSLPRWAIAPVLAVSLLLALIYSLQTPLFEASDELWHYPFVKRLADTGTFVEYDDPAHPAPWRQEAYQPPLYYLVGAAATFWIDTSDLAQVRTINPHADIGVPRPDGNVNMVVHDWEAEAFPWRGTALAVHIVRLLSVAMTTATVYCTYRFALEVFPERRDLALVTAALTGFTPMLLFIGGTVNNDNAVTLLATFVLWQLAAWARQPDSQQPGRRFWLGLGAALGLALLSKASGLGLLALAGLTLGYRIWRAGRAGQATRPLLLGAGLAALVAVAISGWWYWRNWQLYGDPTAISYFLEFVGRRVPQPSVGELWNERWGFMAAYWGFFGGVNVLMPRWIYELLNAVAVLAAAGAVAWLVLWAVGVWRARAWREPAGLSAARSQLPEVRGLRAEFLPLVLAVAWPAIVTAGIIQWAATTLASQGRLLFPAIACFSLWLAVGLSAWVPRRWALVPPAVLSLGLLVLAAAAPFAWIAPAYAPPPALDAARLPAGVTRSDQDFAGQLRLLGYRIEDGAARPGESFVLDLYWQVIAPPERDWSVFLHVYDESDIVVAQRDVYPGLGALAASRLAPGYAWHERHVIDVRETTYAPSPAQFGLGLYDLATGQRARLAGGQDTLRLGTLEIAARPGPIPNPLGVNLENKIELAGYGLDRRAARAGETIELTLYWRGLARMQHNYTVFAHILGEQDVLWGQKDAWPQDGAAPTSAWEPGQLVEDRYPLVVKPDTPPGVYVLEVGVYLGETGERLRVLAPDGRLVDNRVLLSKVRVNAP